MISCISDGAVDALCMITHHATLDQVPDHFDTWLDRDSGCIKAMVSVG